jgi:hypothetical protein
MWKARFALLSLIFGISLLEGRGILNEKRCSFNTEIENFLKTFDHKTPDERFNEKKFDIVTFKDLSKKFLAELDQDPQILYKIHFFRLVNFMKAIFRSCMDSEIMDLLLDPKTIHTKVTKFVNLADTMGETLSINFLYEKNYTPIPKEELTNFFKKINSVLVFCDIIESIVSWYEKESGPIKDSNAIKTQFLVIKSRPVMVTRILIKKIHFHDPSLYRQLLRETENVKSSLYIYGGSLSGIGGIIASVEAEEKLKKESWDEISL